MSDRIDDKFINMILAARTAGTLEITEDDKGARLVFMYRDTRMDMLLGDANWKIVKAALAKGSN